MWRREPLLGARNPLLPPGPAGLEPEVPCGGCGQQVCAHRRLWTWTGQVIWTEDVRSGASFRSGRSGVRSGHLCRPKDPRFRSPGEGAEVRGGRCAQGPTAGSWLRPFWTPGPEGVVMTEARRWGKGGETSCHLSVPMICCEAGEELRPESCRGCYTRVADRLVPKLSFMITRASAGGRCRRPHPTVICGGGPGVNY